MIRFINENIWVIGASTGIGKALAHELAGQGATLILSARNADALQKVKADIGESHVVFPVDVADAALLKKTAQDIVDKVGNIDRVICLAAIYEPSPIIDIDLEFAKKTLEVNLLGTMHLVHAMLPIFERQQGGQMVLCGSIAGYTGLPSGQPYSATKAAVINFAESLYAEKPDYMDVKLISPGFVRTPMTDKNDFDMPMCIEPEDAAKAIAKGLKQRAFEIHFPKRFTYFVKLLGVLPYWMKLFMTKRI